MKLVIIGGHHTSALPVISEIKTHNENFEKSNNGINVDEIQITWIGHKHSLKGDKTPTLEYKEINELGIPFYSLQAGKFYKTYDPMRLAKIPFGFFQAMYYLVKIRPDVILSFGGYLAVPVVLAGKVLGIPSVTHEQTVVTGYANKVISKFADRILLTWPSSQKYYEGKGNVLVTGLPLRSEIFTKKSDSLDLNPNLPTVYVTAGKTGSHKINMLINELLVELLEVANVIHQCGSNSVHNDFSILESTYKKLLDRSGVSKETQGKYNLFKFVYADKIGEVFEEADLVVSRSGAHTTYELLALQKPAILIPIPWVSHNEQLENARLLEKAGLGQILEEKDITSSLLLKKISHTLNNISNFHLNDSSILDLMKSDSAKLILHQVLSVYEQKAKKT